MWAVLMFFSGACCGIATMACLSAKRHEELQRALALSQQSRDYWLGVAVQYESAYEVERGIAIIGQQVDAAAKEMGL